MTKLLNLSQVVLAATLLLGTGCASNADDPATPDVEFELASEANLDALSQEPSSLEPIVGCSNAQISSAQDACRSTFCGSRGSYGIHWCDQRPDLGLIYAQCDCKSGDDPVIVRSL